MANVHRDLALVRSLFKDDVDAEQLTVFYMKVLNKNLSSMPEFAVMMGLDPNAILAKAIVSKVDEHLATTTKLSQQFAGKPTAPTSATSSASFSAEEVKTPSYSSAATSSAPPQWTQVDKSTHNDVVKSYPPRRSNDDAQHREVSSLPALTGLECCYPRDQDRFLHAVRVGDSIVRMKNNGTMPNGIPIGWTDHGDGWYGHIHKSMTIHKYNPTDHMFSLHMEWDVDMQDYKRISRSKFVEDYDRRGARF